jgi:hypothetical protein
MTLVTEKSRDFFRDRHVIHVSGIGPVPATSPMSDLELR